MIYCPHSTSFDFATDWYQPLRVVGDDTVFVLPHEKSTEQFASRAFLESGQCTLVLAEVSHPSLGLGIELGWASLLGVPIVGLHRTGAKPSGAIYAVTDRVIPYQLEDLSECVQNIITQLYE